MLRWEKNYSTLILHGLTAKGKESSLYVYERYNENWIFSCQELGVTLHTFEGTEDEVKEYVLKVVKERLIGLAADIMSNLEVLEDVDVSVIESVKIVA